MAYITTEYNKLKNGSVAENNGAFVTGGQVFNELKSVVRPSDVDWQVLYQPIKYVEADGTQWIDTGITPSKTMGIKIKYRYTTAGASPVSGLLKLTSPRNDALLVSSYSGSTDSTIFLAHAGEVCDTQLSIALDTDYIVEINYGGSGKFAVNGTEYGDVGTTDTSTAKTLPIFSRYNVGNSTYSDSNSRIYSVEITDGANIIMNLNPAYRRSDKVVGMYDTISDTFFENAGTDTFDADMTVVNDGGGGIHVGTTPPENTSLIWIDTDDNSAENLGTILQNLNSAEQEEF